MCAHLVVCVAKSGAAMAAQWFSQELFDDPNLAGEGRLSCVHIWLCGFFYLCFCFSGALVCVQCHLMQSVPIKCYCSAIVERELIFCAYLAQKQIGHASA